MPNSFTELTPLYSGHFILDFGQMLSLLERFHCNPVGALSASVYNGGISQDVIICEGMCYYIIYCAREKNN